MQENENDSDKFYIIFIKTLSPAFLFGVYAYKDTHSNQTNREVLFLGHYVQLKKQWDAYHNQFDDLDERIDALEKKIWEQERIIKYYDLHRNKDYFEKSQYHGGGSVLQRMVNNPELTGDLDKAATVGKVVGAVPGIAAHIYDELTYDNLHYMEAKERENFNYINETEGEAAAKEYLEWLQPVLNERSMNKKMEWVSAATQSVPVLSQAVASQLSTPIRLLGGGLGLIDATGQKIRNAITGENKPIDYNTDTMFFSKVASTIRGTVAQNIVDITGYIDLDEEDHPVLSRMLNGKSLADLYLLGMGMQDSAAVVALAMISPVLGKLGTVLLATSTGTEVMLNTVSKGGSDEQALTMGILAAAFEMIFEKYELESLLGQGKNAWQAFWRQGLSEAVGEGATEAASILADIAVMAEKSDWRQNIQHYLDENPDWDYRQAEQQAFIDAALQVGGATVGGWFTGGTMGGGYSKIQSIADRFQKSRQAYNQYVQSQQEMVTEALELNPNNAYAQKLQSKSDAAKKLSATHPQILTAQNETVIQANDTQNTQTEQAEKESKNPTAENIGQSQKTVQSAAHEATVTVNQEDIAHRLLEKGFYSQKAAGVAEAVAARLNGQDLTQKQSSVLRTALDSPTVQSVISDIQKNQANQIDEVSQNPIARSAEQLNATAQVANNQENVVVNQADVAKSLRSKGVYSKEVDGIAEAITARLNHQDLTRPQQSLLSFALNTSAVRDTISEFINRRKTSTEQPSSGQGYQNFLEATVQPEQHMRLEKAGFAWEHEESAKKAADRKGRTRNETLANQPNDATMNLGEMYSEAHESRKNFKFLSDERFEALTIEVRKKGAVIVRGTPEVERHLDMQGASAAALGDVLLFRKDVCLSEVLEETHHFNQNLIGLNNDKKEPLRTILNEIDAKEYIIRVAAKYQVPRNELEHIKKQLESYRRQLKNYKKGG